MAKMPLNHPEHPHRELILAWMQGAKIQRRCANETAWADVTYPHWKTNCRYRIAASKIRTKKYYSIVPCTRLQEADIQINFVNGTPTTAKIIQNAFIV